MDYNNIIYRSDLINMINDAREAYASCAPHEREFLDMIYSKLEDFVCKAPAAAFPCPYCGEPIQKL